MYNLQDLNAASPEELLEIAKTFDIKKADKMAQQDLIFTILDERDKPRQRIGFEIGG